MSNVQVKSGPPLSTENFERRISIMIALNATPLVVILLIGWITGFDPGRVALQLWAIAPFLLRD